MSTRESSRRLLGRRSECAALDRLLANVRAGPSRALVLRGEAGVGKSALLEYAGQHASGCTPPVSGAAGARSPSPAASTPAGCSSRPAWHYRRPPRVGGSLARRQANAEPEILALSWKAQRRLHHLWQRMEQRGNRRTIIAVAAARELAGFCWAVATTD